ncbi:hypothetical protein [Streptomyces sp. HUAS TT7]|uniref:hypothetical protein n=1 Tax=Streptomyces sp. HUAS TT7 TaxID=3447507 RepID=UPI003F65FB6D
MDQAKRTFPLALRFEATGRAMEGTWASRATADYKLRYWTGVYGTAAATATIRLWEPRPDGREHTLGVWLGDKA